MAGKGKGKKARKKWFVVSGVLVLIVAGAVIFGISMQNRSVIAGNMAKMAVKSETVSTGNISNTVEGSGSIEVANTVDVTIPTGIKVKVVLVESGDMVTEGQTLATLDTNSIISALADIEESIDSVEDSLDKDGISALQKKKLKGDKTDLIASRKVLRSLRKNPVIVASADGVIGSVNVSDGSETSQSSGSSSSQNSNSQGMANMSSSGKDTATGLNYSSSGKVTATSMNYSSSGKVTATALDYSSSETDAQQETGAIQATNLLCTTALEAEESDGSGDTEKTVITDFKDLIVAKPVTGNKPQSVIKETDDYTGVISWNLATEKFQEQLAYTATITLTAKEGKVFSKDYTPSLENANSVNTKISVVDGESVMTVIAKYAKTAAIATAKPKAAITQKPSSTANNSSKSGSKNGSSSSVGNQSGNSNSLSNQNGNSSGNQTSSSKSQMDATSNENLSSTVSNTKTSSASSNDTSIYSDSESVAFTIQKQDSVMVSLSVDELDILSVKKGQTATVTLDAIEDKEFEGTITKVADAASSGEGNAKYEVDITLEKDADMRIGMTASATINVSEVNDVLMIPMNALQQKGDETFVYTKQDDDGNLSGEVTVETGLSDGQKVEIKSGLSEGDTIYYTRTGSNSDSNSDKGMGRGNMPGGDFGGFQKGNGNFEGGHGNRPLN